MIVLLNSGFMARSDSATTRSNLSLKEEGHDLEINIAGRVSMEAKVPSYCKKRMVYSSVGLSW